MNQYLMRATASRLTDYRRYSSSLMMMFLVGWLGLGGALGYGAIAAIRTQTGSALGQEPTVVDQTGPALDRTTIGNDAEPTRSQAVQGQQLENNDADETTSAGAVVDDSMLDDASPVTRAQESTESIGTLGGVHGFTTDLIGWSTWGTAEVNQNGDGSFNIRGSQLASEDSLTIDGVLRIESGERLLFDGVVESQTEASGGVPCIRVGEMTFEAPEGKRYWRLVEDQNPCGSYTERIDIYFAGL